MRRLKERVTRCFPEREIFMRANGQVRFVRISSAIQIRIVLTLGALLLVWLSVTGVTLFQRWDMERRAEMLGARAAEVAQSAGKVAAFRSSVHDIAARLEDRQKRLDQIVTRYFGAIEQKPAQPVAAAVPVPEAGRLGVIERQQIAFAGALSSAAAERSREAADTLRRFGINPGPLAPSSGMGGPFVPVTDPDAAFLVLGQSLSRLDRLERAVLALPAVTPATPVVLASRFGVRADPFNGRAAMHTGLDIKGRHGQPIVAAAAGRVIRAGRWSGYGNVVVLSHGHGLETRYGHLSGIDVRQGEMVRAGEQVGRMGSTGRSTGNHLHFEVRINGRALNPRPFLEASADVLEIQARVGQRVAARTGSL